MRRLVPGLLLLVPGVGHAAAWTFYLNRDGGTFWGGYDDARNNRSSVLANNCGPGATAEIAPFPFGDDTWNAIVSCTQEAFAPFDVEVTDVEPLEGTYVETVVGGSPSDLCMGAGTAGVATQMCAPSPYAVAWVFAEASLDDPDWLCFTVSQETAHTFGLVHELACDDFMTYLPSCGPKTFVDRDVDCGEYEPIPCRCGGGDQQNSYRMLMDAIGPRPEPEPEPDAGLDSDASVADAGAEGDHEFDPPGCACNAAGRTAGPWPLAAPFFFARRRDRRGRVLTRC
jgi:hypothetical protein